MKVDDRDDIKAETITANKRPLRPLGRILITKVGYATFVQPPGCPHASMHFSKFFLQQPAKLVYFEPFLVFSLAGNLIGP